MYFVVLMVGGEVYLGLVWFFIFCYSSVCFYMCSFLYIIFCMRVKIVGRNVILNFWIFVCVSVEVVKNKFVEMIMYCLMKYVVWINIYLVLIFVLEICVVDGYGVCWLVDGSKVIFFYSFFERI